MAPAPLPYVSRGGLKLAAALDAFGLDVHALRCADLGCNVGGFTDCLLQRGAAGVYAVDTGYGTLAWKLRQDPRVTVLERCNALYLDPGTLAGFTGCDLVVIDLGWTRQKLAIPAALRWLRKSSAQPGPIIISLIKPHYEAERTELAGGNRGVLDEAQAQMILTRVLEQMPVLGVTVTGHVRSPIRGGASRGREGNVEYLALLTPAPGL
jgi:23S rRNA (cytidine1920-2'-O)/16S rRNA (cytidine1409-2'-O)-methyltransferase